MINLHDDLDAIKELIFKEYDYTTRLLISNEHLGEKRLDFFITIVTAGLTLIFALTGNTAFLLDSQVSLVIFPIGIIIMLLFGLITYLDKPS